MDKEFFENLEQRKQDFIDRAGVDGVRAEMTLGNGRSFVIERVVSTADAWLQVDGHDPADDTVPLSLTLPYWQVSFVSFIKERPRMKRAGFAP